MKIGMIVNWRVGEGLRKNSCVAQLSLFSRSEIAGMRDRTARRNYSAAAEEFRREHERHRQWGLAQRHGEKLRRLRFSRSGLTTAPTPGSGLARSTPPAPPPAPQAPAPQVVPASQVFPAPRVVPASQAVPAPRVVPASQAVPASRV